MDSNTKVEENLSTKVLAVFGSHEFRRKWHDGRMFFSVSDVVFALTESADVKQYIKKLRERDNELYLNWGTICTLLRVKSKDGKMREENMADLQGIFRIIQSIPSPKAEPLKLWLAQLGKERIDEIQDPELVICTL